MWPMPSKFQSIFTRVVLCICAVTVMMMIHCESDHSVYSYPTDDLVVVWTVEGSRSDILKDIDIDTSSVQGTGNDDHTFVIIDEMNTGYEESDLKPHFKYDAFVTGNEYTIGDYKISIFSLQGQELNQAIIDQRDLQKESFLHKIKYYDRFSDGYVEIAEALLDPLGKQTYFVGGSVYDYNPKSNLELFVLERGYSLENLQAIPNDIFSPMEFTLGRALLDNTTKTGGDAGDLRVYSPNYMIFDNAQLEEQLKESLAEQTSTIFGQIFLAPEQVEPEPDLYTLTPAQSTIVILDSDSTTEQLPLSSHFVNPTRDAFEQSQFEDPSRVDAAIKRYNDDLTLQIIPNEGQDAFLNNNNNNIDATYSVILLAVSISVGLACFGYVMWRVYNRDSSHKDKQPLLIKSESILPIYDYVESSRSLLSHSRKLNDSGYHKEAHEILGQAIRLFYSHRLNAGYVLTNSELLARMQKMCTTDKPNHEYELVQKWLIVCGSVAYARHRYDKRVYSDVLEGFSNVVGR